MRRAVDGSYLFFFFALRVFFPENLCRFLSGREVCDRCSLEALRLVDVETEVEVLPCSALSRAWRAFQLLESGRELELELGSIVSCLPVARELGRKLVVRGWELCA